MNKKNKEVDKTNRFKIVLLGESGVGKSSLAMRFVKGQFSESTPATIGAAFVTSSVHTDDGPIALDIWDTAGQERFRSLTPMYYRNADGALIVYSVTDPKSFREAERWIKDLKGHNDSPCVVGVAGNKSDVSTTKAVQSQDAQNFADANGLLFLETSAKTNMNVTQIFTEMAKEMRDKRLEKESSSKQNISLQDQTTKTKKCC